MDFREIGDRIGREAIEEQIVQGKKFNEDLKGALPDEAQGTELQRLMARIFGTSIAEHTVGYGGKVTAAPNQNPGLDLALLCVVMQVTEVGEAGTFVAIWWKVGAAPTDWVNLAGSVDDHLVIASSSDMVPGALDVKEAAGVGIHQEVKTIGGVLKLETSSLGLVVAVPGDTPDVLYRRVRGRSPLHTNVLGDAPDRYVEISIEDQPTPAANASTLYPTITAGTARVAKCILAPTPRWSDVECVGFGYTPFARPGGGWSETASGVWTLAFAIPLDPDGSGYFDYVVPYLGMKFLFVYGDSESNAYEQWQGVYVITNMGGSGEYPQIARATDADSGLDFLLGKPVHVLGGNSSAGHTFRYSGSDNPTVGTDSLPFWDDGTDSIYASGAYGFGAGKVWQPVAGISTFSRTATPMIEGAPAQPAPAIKGLAADGSATIPIEVGDEFLVLCDPDEGESPYFGLFKLVSTYLAGTSPTIARAIEANEPAELTGLALVITGAGALSNGTVFTQTSTVATVDTDSTSWEESSVAPGAEKKLLTGAQLVPEGATSDTREYSTAGMLAGDPMAPLDAVTGSGRGFTTIVGTPGMDEIPAALHTVQARVRVSGGDVGASANLIATLSVIPTGWMPEDGIPSPFLTLTSAPLYSTTDETQTFQAKPTAPVTVSPTDRIILRWYGTTNSVTVPMVVTLTWQDPGRITRLTVPYELVVSGVSDGDHRHLSHREDPGQHPSGAITAGEDVAAFSGVLTAMVTLRQCLAVLDKPTTRWRLDGWGMATVDANGVVTIPVPYRRAKLSVASGPITINGINPTGWEDGYEATLLVLATDDHVATVSHKAVGLADNARLVLNQASGAQFTNTALLRFVLDKTTLAGWPAQSEPIVFQGIP